MKADICYNLKFYVREFCPTGIAKRGGEIYKPFYKKDIKPFTIRVKCAVNKSAKVIRLTSDRYPIILN